MTTLPPKLASRIQLLTPRVHHPLIVCSVGLEGVGKTAWALSAGTPERPGLYVPLDRAVTSPHHNALIRKGGIYVPKFNFRVNDPRKVGKAEGEKYLGELEDIIMETLAPSSPIAGVILDTANYYWMLVRLAEFGKIEKVMPHQYGPANTRFESIFHRAEESGKWLIAIHKYGKKYVTKGDKEVWNGEYERKGYGDIGYLASVSVEHYRTTVALEGGGYSTSYGTRVLQNKINGQETEALYEGEMENTFGWMAAQTYTDSDPGEWGL